MNFDESIKIDSKGQLLTELTCLSVKQLKV